MVEQNNFQMAVDLLCCHLGISEDEAKQQLGIGLEPHIGQQVEQTPQAFTSYELDK